ncbi:MAG: hypothetical protein JW776_13900 [Candidatus Lokiarchaeota archaeon]|nr:hypothetical protein [Candidatus Lokiarchaeota archaeon]
MNVEKTHPTEKDRIAKLRAEYERLNIREAAFTIKERSEEIAKQHNIRAPYLKRFNRINLVIMAALIGTIFIFYIPTLRPYQIYSFLLILPVCFLPNFLKKYMKKKWNEFKYMHREELQQEIYDQANKIKTFIQILLDDARDYMLEEQFPLQVLEFPLMSNDYTSLSLVRENIQEEQVQYIFRFEYPEGIEPFETPQTIKTGGVGKPTAVSTMDLSEDDENDLFLIIKDPKYDENGQLLTDDIDFVQLGFKPIVESLLENSLFDRIEDIDKIIPNIEEFNAIHCDCGSPVKIGEIQKVTPKSYKEFHFYLMIGKKCEKCKTNPFVLTPLPNMNVPEELTDIFIDPIPMEAKSEENMEVDLFSVMRNVTYNEEGVLQLSDYTPLIIENNTNVQNLLAESTFKKLNDPKKRFSDFEAFKIPCGCDDTAKLIDVQLVTSKEHNGFKFYLLMGQKCEKCKVEPFLLVPTPNEVIPDQLKSIF